MRIQNVDSLTATGYIKRPPSAGEEDPASVRSRLQRHRQDDSNDPASNQLWTLAMVITLFGGLGGGLYLTKGVWYELYAVTHPFHDTPTGDSTTNEISQPRIFGDSQVDSQNVGAVAKVPVASYEAAAATTLENSGNNGEEEEEAGVNDTELEAEPGLTEEVADSSATVLPASERQGEGEDEGEGKNDKEVEETSRFEEPLTEGGSFD
eukprot:8302363-Pyramimonas_sp.AAC.1